MLERERVGDLLLFHLLPGFPKYSSLITLSGNPIASSFLFILSGLLKNPQLDYEEVFWPIWLVKLVNDF